jgi:hypothetical protein
MKQFIARFEKQIYGTLTGHYLALTASCFAVRYGD